MLKYVNNKALHWVVPKGKLVYDHNDYLNCGIEDDCNDAGKRGFVGLLFKKENIPDMVAINTADDRLINKMLVNGYQKYITEQSTALFYRCEDRSCNREGSDLIT